MDLKLSNFWFSSHCVCYCNCCGLQGLHLYREDINNTWLILEGCRENEGEKIILGHTSIIALMIACRHYLASWLPPTLDFEILKAKEILFYFVFAVSLNIKIIKGGLPLVTQWLRVRLPMQGTWVQALVREDPTCRRATKPMCHNYWDCALEPVSHNYWAHAPQLLKPTCLEPVLHNKRSSHNEKPVHHNEE